MNFEKIYEEFQQPIFRLCLGYTNDADWAKDIVQDTFIAVWKNKDKFRGESQISTWIYRIAANNCLKQLAREKKRKLEVTTTAVEEEEENPKLKILRELISTLSEVDRLIISMELEELPQAEIAEALGLSPGNVRVRIHRIKEKLSNKFKSLGYV